MEPGSGLDAAATDRSAGAPDGRSAVGEFFDGYRRAFLARDREGLLERFTFPLHVVGGEADDTSLAVFESQEWPGIIDALLGAYGALQVADATILALDTIQLTPALFSVRVNWQLLRADGSTVYEFTSVYTLLRTAGVLLIGAVAHDESPKLTAALMAAAPS